jgi:hypothetical protein
MRQNQNSILRSAVAEGKSVNRSSEQEHSPKEHYEVITGRKIAERPKGRPAGPELLAETTPCRRFSRRYRPR